MAFIKDKNQSLTLKYNYKYPLIGQKHNNINNAIVYFNPFSILELQI